MAPNIKGDDIIRAYGPKAARPDVNAMIVRGFEAAAEAMLLLGGASRMPRDTVSPSPCRTPVFRRRSGSASSSAAATIPSAGWTAWTGTCRIWRKPSGLLSMPSHCPRPAFARDRGHHPHRPGQGHHPPGAGLLRLLPAQLRLQRLHGPAQPPEGHSLPRHRHQPVDGGDLQPARRDSSPGGNQSGLWP